MALIVGFMGGIYGSIKYKIGDSGEVDLNFYKPLVGNTQYTGSANAPYRCEVSTESDTHSVTFYIAKTTDITSITNGIHCSFY